MDVVIIKLYRFNYTTKHINITDFSSFTNIKNHVYTNYDNYISKNDIHLWIYAGKLITDSTDLTTITHPICCYILTELMNSNYSSIFTNIFNRISSGIIDMDDFIYREQMNQMLDMGFSNEDYIRDALILSEGRITDAISMYISF
jgi:hypothetical protein